MNTSSERYVFVYGTLRRGEVRDINRLHPAPTWVGRGRVAGVLYDLGSYPGLRLEPTHDSQVTQLPVPQVAGEIYRITPELERQLDAIEEVWPQQTGEYVRREVPVRVALDTAPEADSSPHVLVCLLYEISAERLIGKSRIVSGDWVRRNSEGA